MRYPSRVSGLLAVLCLAGAEPCAGSLVDLLREPSLVRLELAPLGPALAATVASTYPVASASASVVYLYEPTTDSFERRARIAGPIFGERAETIGPGELDAALTYSHVRLSTINGEDLGELRNRRTVDGRFVVLPVPDGTLLRDGRFTNFLPVRVLADLDVAADIVSPSVTYGITEDLDVNLSLPVLRTSLDVTTRTQIPDPRFPRFALPPGSAIAGQAEQSFSDSAAGVGDVLLRAKYLVRRGRPVDVALGLGVSLPTGDEDDFQGSGTTRVQPALILSRVVAGRIEPLLNVGMDLNADDVDRSVARWAAGATAEIVNRLTAAVVFLGRHELAAQADRIRSPFFFQIERSDIFDAALGLRWRFAENGVVSANALVPLNDQGLRPNVIPTVEVEYVFATP